METGFRLTVEVLTAFVFAAFCLSAPRVLDLPSWTLALFAVPVVFYLRWRLAANWSCLRLLAWLATFGAILFAWEHWLEGRPVLLITAVMLLCWLFRRPNRTLQRAAMRIAESRIRTLSRPRHEPAVLAAIAGIAVVGWLIFGGQPWTEICTGCGAIQDRREWKIPLTGVTYARSSGPRETPVTIALTRAGLVSGEHRHQWFFKQSGGRPPAVCSEGVAVIITASHRFGATPFRDRLAEAVLDSRKAEAARAVGLTAPAEGFADAAEFHAWLAQEGAKFEEQIRDGAGR